MAEFIIDPSKISYEELLSELNTFIENKDDYTAWKDFYESSTGQVIIQLVSGLATYLATINAINRRETYLFYAENRSSAIAVAENLGYSSYRGSNYHLRLNITADQAGNFTALHPTLGIVGSYSEYDLIAISDKSFADTDTTDIDVVIGTVKEEEITVTSDNIGFFRFITPGVSEDIKLFLNDSEVPISTVIADLINDKYAVLSNALGSVDAMYTNDESGSYTFAEGDVIKLRYIELANTGYELAKVSFDYGTLNTVTILSYYQQPEELREIRINAPIHHETQLVVRGRNDYKKIVKSLIPNCVSTNGYDTSPAVVDLTYVRLDETDTHQALTSQEKTDLINALEPYRPFGVEPPTISEPTLVACNLTVTIVLSDTSVSQATIEADVKEILDEYEFELENGLSDANMNIIEESIEELSYVKVARIQITNGASQSLAWNEYYDFTTTVTVTSSV